MFEKRKGAQGGGGSCKEGNEEYAGKGRKLGGEFHIALPERVEVYGLSRSGQECGWGEEKASVVAVRDFPITRGCIKTRCFDTASL